MKRFLSFAAGTAVFAAPVFAGNLLLNGDLENPVGGGFEDIDNWTLIEPDVDDMGMPTNSAEFRPFGPHSGVRALWFRAFEGGLGGDNPMMVNATLQQSVAGNAGEDYSLSAWYRYEDNYSGLDPFAPTQTILAMDFLDAGNSVISTVSLDVDGVYNAAPGSINTWQQFSVNGLAPAGTAAVRARASFIDGTLAAANPQSAFVDTFSLVPEPTSLGLLLLAGAFVRRR